MLRTTAACIFFGACTVFLLTVSFSLLLFSSTPPFSAFHLSLSTECCEGQTQTLKGSIAWFFHKEPWLQEQERMAIFRKLHGCISRLGVLKSTEYQTLNLNFEVSRFFGVSSAGLSSELGSFSIPAARGPPKLVDCPEIRRNHLRYHYCHIS